MNNKVNPTILQVVDNYEKAADDLIATLDFSVEGLAANGLGAQLTMYNVLKVLLDKASEVVTCLNKNMPVVASRAATLMMVEDVDSISADGYAFTVKPKHYISTNKADVPALHQWLAKDEEGAGLVKPTVHPASLTKFITERFIEQGVTPPQFINIFTKQELSVRKNRS